MQSKKNKQISFSVPADEHAQILARAEAAGTTVASYCRSILLGGGTYLVPIEDGRLVARLRVDGDRVVYDDVWEVPRRPLRLRAREIEHVEAGNQES